MTTLMLIVGVLLTALSALVLAIIVAGLIKAQLTVRAHGINEAVPVDRKSALIIGGWTVALIIGVLLIVQP
jgi:hypothetical protein